MTFGFALDSERSLTRMTQAWTIAEIVAQMVTQLMTCYFESETRVCPFCFLSSAALGFADSADFVAGASLAANLEASLLGADWPELRLPPQSESQV